MRKNFLLSLIAFIVAGCASNTGNNGVQSRGAIDNITELQINNIVVAIDASGNVIVPQNLTMQQWAIQYGTGDKIACRDDAVLLGYPIIRKMKFFSNTEPGGRLTILFDKNNKYLAQGKDAQKLCMG
jgi:hypothetical protein